MLVGPNYRLQPVQKFHYTTAIHVVTSLYFHSRPTIVYIKCVVRPKQGLNTDNIQTSTYFTKHVGPYVTDASRLGQVSLRVSNVGDCVRYTWTDTISYY